MKKITTLITIILCFCFQLSAGNKPFTEKMFVREVDFTGIDAVKNGWAYANRLCYFKSKTNNADWSDVYYSGFRLTKVRALTDEEKEAIESNKEYLKKYDDFFVIPMENPILSIKKKLKIALAMGATLVIIGGVAYCCYPEKVKSAANSVVSAGGTVCSYIVYPFALAWGKVAGK